MMIGVLTPPYFQIAEFDSRVALLERKESLFRSLAQESGLVS